MAKILTFGNAPLWGVNKHQINGVIIDSYNESVEIKDYEQTDEKGAVCGYLIYDQTKSFDMSGTLLANKSFDCMSVGKCAAQFIGTTGLFNLGVNCGINNPSAPIIKSLSFASSAGGAQTFSASGTIYDFSVPVNCEN